VNKRERVLAVATGGVLVLALGISLVEPALDHWKDLADERAELEDALARSRDMAERLPELRLERAALDARLRSDVGEAVVPGLVALVRELSREAGFLPTSLRFLRAEPLDPRQPDGPFAEVRFDLRARTTLQKVTQFGVLLAASERPLRVVSLTLTPRSQGEGLEVNMSLAALVPADEFEEGAR
jgi:hypothetical protein